MRFFRDAVGIPIVGFVVIALFLYLLRFSSVCTYRFLTGWANQPPVPTLKGCAFTEIPMPEIEKSATLASLKNTLGGKE